MRAISRREQLRRIRVLAMLAFSHSQSGSSSMSMRDGKFGGRGKGVAQIAHFWPNRFKGRFVTYEMRESKLRRLSGHFRELLPSAGGRELHSTARHWVGRETKLICTADLLILSVWHLHVLLNLLISEFLPQCRTFRCSATVQLRTG